MTAVSRFTVLVSGRDDDRALAAGKAGGNQPNHKIVEAVKLESPPGGLNLSVSPDERYALLTKPDFSGTDLLLVNNFR